MSDKATLGVTALMCVTLIGLAMIGYSCEDARQQALVECIKKTDKPLECRHTLGN